MDTARFQPYALSLMRIMFGFAFIQHGVQKWLGWLGGMGGAAAPTGSMLWTAGVIETFGGILIILGLFTRPVALILAGQMAFAFFTAHLPRGFWTLNNGGELAVLYCFAYLYLVTAGGGAWSLDRWLRGK